MNCNEVKYYLNDYSKGFLLDEIRVEIHEHLNWCNKCIKTFDGMITASSKTGLKKNIVNSKEEELEKIQAKIGKNINTKKFVPRIFPVSQNTNSEIYHLKTSWISKVNEIENNKLFFIGGIISVIALGVILAFIIFDHSPSAFWSVEKLSGNPIIESRFLTDQGIIKIGEKLITDSESRVRFKVGTGSEIDVQPKSEIQIIETKNSEHRLILSRGQIAARTWAAPKLFYVKTPSAIVTDLGSEYDLSVDHQASTSIKVKSGWVLMKYKNRRVLLCAETTCVSDSSKGLGTPFSNESSSLFKESLFKLDFKINGKKELANLLSEANQKDLITLFHLLNRLDKESRGLIYDRISLLFKMPLRITHDGIVNGDKDMMGRLWTELGLGSISIYQYL